MKITVEHAIHVRNLLGGLVLTRLGDASLQDRIKKLYRQLKEYTDKDIQLAKDANEAIQKAQPKTIAEREAIIEVAVLRDFEKQEIEAGIILDDKQIDKIASVIDDFPLHGYDILEYLKEQEKKEETSKTAEQ